MQIIGYTYEGGFHCPRHAALRFTPAQLLGEEEVWCKDGTAPTPVFDHDETPEGGWTCEEDLDEEIARREAKPTAPDYEGPWSIDDETDDIHSSAVQLVIRDNAGEFVCEFRFDQEVNEDAEQAYNETYERAHLVSAAPELYKSLDNLLAYMDGYEHDYNHDKEIPQFAAARAALAKASR